MYAIIPPISTREEKLRNVSDLRRVLLSIIDGNLDEEAVAIDGSEDSSAAPSPRFLPLFLPFSINDRFAFMIHKANVTRNGSARLRGSLVPLVPRIHRLEQKVSRREIS